MGCAALIWEARREEVTAGGGQLVLLFPFSSWAGRHTERGKQGCPHPPRGALAASDLGCPGGVGAHLSPLPCPGRHPGSAPCLCLSPPPVPILLSNSTFPLLSDTRKSFPLRSWRQGDQGQLGPFPPSPPCPLQPALASALGWPLCLPALGPPLSACRSGWPACCVIGLLGSAGSDLSLLWPRSLPPAAHPSLLQTGPCTAFLDCHSPPPLFFYPISLFPFAVFGNLLSVRPKGSSVCMKPRVWHVSLYSQTQ